MSDEPSPRRRRRGRGARERILKAATELFTAQGVNATGMDQLTSASRVSKRTLYAHFAGKDDLVLAYLRELQDGLLPGAPSDDADPREQLLAIFDEDWHTVDFPLRGCPYINAVVEVPAPDGPVQALAAAYKTEFARRLTALARQAGARDPGELGERLALLYDGAVARNMVFDNTEATSRARAVAAGLVDEALADPDGTRTATPA
ncbi:TetR/AcrR family transcriptional regulator [Streptomyces sp. NPDC051014]|uniref:TetR/AcrR family transcriptional regulator n=1 Tax=Streptomyces sp. NPDC051014 TaxID=3155751 RepID=UPI003406AEA6